MKTCISLGYRIFHMPNAINKKQLNYTWHWHAIRTWTTSSEQQYCDDKQATRDCDVNQRPSKTNEVF